MLLAKTLSLPLGEVPRRGGEGTSPLRYRPWRRQLSQGESQAVYETATKISPQNGKVPGLMTSQLRDFPKKREVRK